MDDIWERGRRHVKISKLYLKGLWKRGPSIFVALAWSQAFWLILEATAGNEDSRGYVRLSSVATYALALHTGGHLVLRRYSSEPHKLGHHALEFLLDLVTDVVGFAWINLAEEVLAQVFEVRLKTTLLYAALAFVASLGAMEAGSLARSFLEWPVDFEPTANQFDAGSFALPTSWLITQAVHIGLYGFFYRTAGGEGGRGNGRDVDGDDDGFDIRPLASLFLLAYALLCSLVATRVIGGTVAASTVTAGGGSAPINGSGGGGEGSDGSSGNDLLIQAISSYEVTAAQASDAEGVTAATAVADTRPHGEPPPLKSDGGEERRATVVAAVADAVAAAAGEEAELARQQSLRRGLKAYMRLTVGLMVGWAYNLWGQVEFRQEELEFRFGPALGAIAYASLSTALGVCIMVRGADKLDASIRKGDGGGRAGVAALADGGERAAADEEAAAAEEEMYNSAVRSFHARRLLVVVGGVSLVVGWAWEEAFDLLLEGLVGDEADAGTVCAKLALALVSTVVVLGREIRAGRHGGHHDGVVGDGSSGEGAVGGDLLEPLVDTDGNGDGNGRDTGMI